MAMNPRLLRPLARRTLYYHHSDLYVGDWATLANWWLDSGHTVPSPGLPTAADNVIATAPITTNSGSAPTVANLTLNNPSEEEFFSLGIPITVTANATLTGKWINAATLTGNATFNAYAYNNFGATVTGNATFNGEFVVNQGTVGGNATFNGSSQNSGDVNGNATFNDSSYNGNTVIGNATFNDSSQNAGSVSANATFNGSSLNNLGYVAVNATFNDSSQNGGSVEGTATFTGSACNITGSGSASTFVPNPPPSCP